MGPLSPIPTASFTESMVVVSYVLLPVVVRTEVGGLARIEVEAGEAERERMRCDWLEWVRALICVQERVSHA